MIKSIKFLVVIILSFSATEAFCSKRHIDEVDNVKYPPSTVAKIASENELSPEEVLIIRAHDVLYPYLNYNDILKLSFVSKELRIRYLFAPKQIFVWGSQPKSGEIPESLLHIPVIVAGKSLSPEVLAQISHAKTLDFRLLIEAPTQEDFSTLEGEKTIIFPGVGWEGDVENLDLAALHDQFKDTIENGGEGLNFAHLANIAFHWSAATKNGFQQNFYEAMESNKYLQTTPYVPGNIKAHAELIMSIYCIEDNTYRHSPAKINERERILKDLARDKSLSPIT